ncbi:hypothetical protein [Thalassotalea atypica]|uniref:hypothetical protein n=1 Tax=Thalassotalea atypica TaxID=2054316 RepID=UPI0025742402|nr:hypothetical protein [Thalassotalea atypica]
MAKRDRETLKRFFQRGALPSADHFSDFIDSSLNMREDGFSKTPEEGFQISTLANKNSLISFYQRNDFNEPIWSFKFNESTLNNLDLVQKINEKQPRNIVSFNPLGYVGINNDSPARALDVNGNIRAHGREGAEPKVVYADSTFYDITEGLDGCHAIDVVAGVGLKFSGMYALLHATAMNTFHPDNLFEKIFSFKKRIKKQHSYYSSFSHRIKLRWHKKVDGKYYLQLGTHCDYSKKHQDTAKSNSEKVRVRYHLTFLWHDPFMSSCLETAPDENTLDNVKASNSDTASNADKCE